MPDSSIAITPCTASSFVCGLDNSDCQNPANTWSLNGSTVIVLRASQIANLVESALESQAANSTTNCSSPTGIYKFTTGQMAGLGSAIGFPLALALLVSLLVLRKEKHKHSPPKLMYKLPDNHTEFSFRPPPPLRTQSAMSLGSYHSDRPHSRRDSTGTTATANSKPIHLQSFPERYEQLKKSKVSEFAVERHELDGTLPTYGSRHELAEKHHS
ncbi:hypothetical protein LTR95_002773, partial [Oleoguttula sp. CCFEE 5521]